MSWRDKDLETYLFWVGLFIFLAIVLFKIVAE